MTDEPPTRRVLPRTRYVSASPQTWSLIRGAYLSGLSAPTVAARFGVSVTALRKRARREGWTKRLFAARATPWNACAAAPAPAPDSSPVDAPRDPDAPLTEAEVMAWWDQPVRFHPTDVARKALAGAVEAIKTGHGLNAVRLARAADAVARLDAMLEYAEEDPARAESESQARSDMMRQFIRQQAVRLAEDLAAGRPLPPHYAEAQAINRADDAVLAAEREGSNVS